jgi:hypothetical protein
MSRSLRLATISSLFLLATLLVPSGSAADPALLQMAEPSSNFIISIDMQSLANSPLAQEALLKAQLENPEWESKLEALGPNPLSRIEEIVIVGNMKMARDESKGLVLVRGDFTDDSWIAAVCQSGCTSDNYQGFTLHGVDQADQPGAFVQIDSNYVALGSPDQVRGVIDRRVSGFASRFAADVDSWTSNTAGHQVWIAAKGPFDIPQAGSAPMGMSTLGDLDAFGMGLSFGADLDMGMEFRSSSNAESVTLYQTLQGLLMMFSASADQDPDAAEFFRSLKVEQGAQTVTASLRLPGHVLQRMAEKQMMATSGTVDVSSDVEQPAPRRQRPRQGIIRINGLEGGPIEVESQQP